MKSLQFTYLTNQDIIISNNNSNNSNNNNTAYSSNTNTTNSSSTSDNNNNNNSNNAFSDIQYTSMNHILQNAGKTDHTSSPRSFIYSPNGLYIACIYENK